VAGVPGPTPRRLCRCQWSKGTPPSQPWYSPSPVGRSVYRPWWSLSPLDNRHDAGFLRRDFDVLAEVYCRFLVEAVEHKIKQVLFLYLAVCFGLLHLLLKRMLALTRRDRLKLVFIRGVLFIDDATARACSTTLRDVIDGGAFSGRYLKLSGYYKY